MEMDVKNVHLERILHWKDQVVSNVTMDQLQLKLDQLNVYYVQQVQEQIKKEHNVNGVLLDWLPLKAPDAFSVHGMEQQLFPMEQQHV